jgi:hypothetical protein
MKQEDTEKSMPRRHWLLAGVGVSAGLAGALYATSGCKNLKSLKAAL